ncbi:MAG: GpE family phage tail protein [Aeromonas veronii]
MTRYPANVMKVEGDIYMVFTGWNPASTGEMGLEELMGWHDEAIRRHEEANK